MTRASATVLGVAFMFATSATGQSPSQRTATAAPLNLLDHLVGDWRVVGDVHKKPVAYAMTGRRILDARYVELHMRDDARPSTYEAQVFIGEDTVPHAILVHWLDRFGAAFSVPPGTGSIAGDTLRFQFLYSSGPFRDTFVYHRTSDSWTFHLESGAADGTWKPFADYEVRRTRGGH